MFTWLTRLLGKHWTQISPQVPRPQKVDEHRLRQFPLSHYSLKNILNQLSDVFIADSVEKMLESDSKVGDVCVVEKYSEFGKSTETYLLKRKPSNELSSWLKIENFGKPEQTISFDVIWNDLMYSASYQGIIIKRIDTTLDEMMWCVLTARSKHLVGYDELEMLSSHPTLEYAEAWCEKYALRIRDTRGLTLTAQDLQE